MTKRSQKNLPNQFLRQAREQRGWSQARVAQELGVRLKTVNRWERGTALPHPRLREQLSRLFGKSVAALGLLPEKADEEPEGASNLPSSEALPVLSAVAGSLSSDQTASLSSLWHVPSRRNPYFTGREEILEALHAQIGAERAIVLTQPAALHGLGGVGKTQIALEYAYRHAQDYRAVFWIGAETEEQVVASLLRVASVLGLSERDEQDQQRVVAAVQRWLSAHGQWLLIWDNMEELELLNRYLPATGSGAVLITTRCQVLGTLARGIDLVPMELEEGVLFLLRRAKVLPPEATPEQVQQFAFRVPADYTAAVELVSALGGLPLALDQAGAYLEKTHCGVPAYLDRFRTQRAALLTLRGEGAQEHPASVSTTFVLALTATARHHPAVLDLLRVCAFLQPDAIPEELFLQAGGHLGAALEAVRRDLLAWDQVVGAACSSSLLSRQPAEQTLSLHRLVQAVLLDAMSEAEYEQWTTCVIEALDAIFPNMSPATETALREQCDRLLPHALHGLRQAGSRGESLALASLACKTAYALHMRARYAEAEPLHLRALHIREQVLGPVHPEVASSLNYLAFLYRDQGNYAEAESLYLRALQIREQALGPSHPEVASALNNLAIVYWMQGNYAQAESLYLRALQIREQMLAPHHLDVATSLNNLAGLYQEQGKHAEAEPLYLRALHIGEQAYGPDHPDMAASLNNLAGLYQEQGQHAEAEPLYLRALHIWEQARGPDHPDIAFPLNNLAELYGDQGRYAEAEPLCLRAVRIWEQTHGPDHPTIAIWLTTLANLSVAQEKYAQAEPLYAKALRLREQALGVEHPQVAEPLNGLARLCLEQNRESEAEALLQRALAIREQHLGPAHPETAHTLHDLAIFHQKQGRLPEAIALAERALQIREQALGEAHPKTVATRALSTQLVQEQQDGAAPTIEHLRTLLKARGWSLHLKERHDKPYVYATRKVGQHTHSRYLAPLSNLAACLAAASTLPNARER